jgi:hypothetical protein
MSITFELPQQIERDLIEQYGDLSSAAKEAMLLEMYRRGVLSHRQLADCLGLDRASTNTLLKHRGIWTASPSLADLQSDSETLERVLGHTP